MRITCRMPCRSAYEKGISDRDDWAHGLRREHGHAQTCSARTGRRYELGISPAGSRERLRHRGPAGRARRERCERGRIGRRGARPRQHRAERRQGRDHGAGGARDRHGRHRRRDPRSPVPGPAASSSTPCRAGARRPRTTRRSRRRSCAARCRPCSSCTTACRCSIRSSTCPTIIARPADGADQARRDDHRPGRRAVGLELAARHPERDHEGRRGRRRRRGRRHARRRPRRSH